LSLSDQTQIEIGNHNPVLSPGEARHWQPHPPFDRLRAVCLLLQREQGWPYCIA